MKTKTCYVVVFLLACFFGQAQKKLTGKVTDFKNRPIVEARIYIDSLDVNCATNSEGEFELLLPQKVSFINVYSKAYGLLSSKYNNEDRMSFKYLESQKNNKIRLQKGEQLPLIYSTVDNEYKINATKNVNEQNQKYQGVFTNIYDLLRGRVSSVVVSRNNKISIRGVSSIRNTAEPLFVVDGMIITSLDYLSPNNVKEITVLKDAAAAAYGAQGSNGVIVIKTK